MPIGPNGERLPYPPGMGAGRGPDLPPMNPAMGAGPGPDLPPMPPPGGNVMAAKQRLMEIVAEADAILTQHPELAEGMAGEEAVPATPVGVPGGMPEMPVAANTGPPMGGMPQGLIA